MTGGQALILAGTGMLAEVAEVLVLQGWHVVLPSRRYSPIPASETKPGMAGSRALRPPGLTRQGVGEPGRAIWVEASWDRPHELAKKTEAVLEGRAGLLVAWVHGQYRHSVMRAVEPLLAPDAPVVEIRAADEFAPAAEVEPSLVAHPTQIVLLGLVSEVDTGRALPHREVAGGALAAIHRAVNGHPPSVHQIGRLRPMVR
jgi:hypothetical protein